MSQNVQVRRQKVTLFSVPLCNCATNISHSASNGWGYGDLEKSHILLQQPVRGSGKGPIHERMNMSMTTAVS